MRSRVLVVDFNLSYACKFGTAGGAGGAGGSGAGDASSDDEVQVDRVFERITPQPDEYTFHLAPGDKQPAADASPATRSAMTADLSTVAGARASPGRICE